MKTLITEHRGKLPKQKIPLRFSLICKGSDKNKTIKFPFNFLRLPPAPV